MTKALIDAESEVVMCLNWNQRTELRAELARSLDDAEQAAMDAAIAVEVERRVDADEKVEMESVVWEECVAEFRQRP